MRLTRFPCVYSVVLAFALALPLSCSSMAQEDATVSSTVPTEDTGDTRTGGPTPYSGSNNRTDQEDARDAVRRGALVSYSLILKNLKKDVPGDVLKVRLLKRTNKLWTYEFTVLDDAGRFTQVSLNARTGKIISKKKR